MVLISQNFRDGLLPASLPLGQRAEARARGEAATEKTDGCELELRLGAGEPYKLSVREGATALRIESVVEQ